MTDRQPHEATSRHTVGVVPESVRAGQRSRLTLTRTPDGMVYGAAGEGLRALCRVPYTKRVTALVGSRPTIIVLYALAIAS